MVGKDKLAVFNIVFQQAKNKMLQYSNISIYKSLNAIFFYLEICVALLAIGIGIAILMACIAIAIEKIFAKLEQLILGKGNERSLKYSVFQVWFLKVYADANILIHWIRVDICGIRYSLGSRDSIVKKVKMVTIENVINITRKCWKFFFKFSIIHILSAIYVIYIFYADSIENFIKKWRMFLTSNTISISDAIDLFEFISILFIIGYIFIDVRHKSNGYAEIRVERFKELFEMEEKLLNILRKMNYSLKNNIEVIVERKSYILSSGAEILTGKKCYISGDTIRYEKKEYWRNWHSNDKYFQLKDLKEMSEEFNALMELDEEFKQSSLDYFNIFMIDHQAMLTRLVRFYFPGHENPEHKKMEFFCKSSMENWFKNLFVEPIFNGNDKKYYTEEQANEVIREMSVALDLEVINAFELEVYLERYERKMTKRFKNINKFSRFNLN